MERQDSASSMGSAVSGMSAMSQAGGDALDGRQGGDLADQSQTLQLAVFGVLMTLFRERWEDSKRYVAARVGLEHLQLLLVLLQAHWMWALNYEHWLWKLVNYVLLQNLTVPSGEAVYMALVYVFIGAVGLDILAFGFVSFTFVKNGSVANRWPVKLLRLQVVLMYQVFYVTILNYLMGPLACRWLASGPVKGIHVFFHEECAVVPHMPQMIVAATFAVLFVAFAGLVALADVSPNPASQHLLSSAHSGVEVKAWAFKTAIVLAANLLTGSWKLQAVPILIAAGWLPYVYIRWQPYYWQWINHLRTGLYGTTAAAALLLTINAWAEADATASGKPAAALASTRAARSQLLTMLLYALMPAGFVVGVVASWLRLALAQRALHKFRGIDLSNSLAVLNLKDLHKFLDEYEAELLARVCRRWVDWEDQLLDEQAVALAEVVMKAGLARFGTRPHMLLAWANFLGSVQGNNQSCSSKVLEARKLGPNWCDRYVIFVRTQQHTALLQQKTGNTESAVDLAGYVEFQRTYKQVLHVHRQALYAQRSFWKVLLRTNVSFSELVRCFRTIEACRGRADRAYRSVLERYPNNIKVLRAYGRFLEDVKNDPWAAAKHYSEADKLEEQEGNGGDDPALIEEPSGGGGGGASGVEQVDEKSNAVCVINAGGIIQMANKKLLKMFGYRKGELEGKNVSMLMPQPFAGRHNGYLRNYQTTGKAQILGSQREVVGLHKERHVFPISLVVSKVSGTGADAIFMAVLKPSAEDEHSVKAWMMPGGTVLCVDGRFTDWLGRMASDVVNRPFSSLGVEAEQLQALMDRAALASEEDLTAGRVSVSNVALVHKYADPQRVDITIELGGTDSQRLLVAVIRKHVAAENEHLMVTDHKGRILYITHKLASLLGAPSSKALLRTEFSRFMAQPFMQLHSKWMKDVPAKVPLSSCRNGTPVVLITAQRNPVPARLEIGAREQGEDNIYIVKVEPLTFPDALHQRRLSLAIDNVGTITSVSDAPAGLFGFKPAGLLGRPLSHCVDVFRGLPAEGGANGLDMRNLLTALVHKTIDQQSISWRCGVHPPMSAEEVAEAQANVIQANMLANQTKAGLLQLEVVEADDEHGGVTGIVAHLWRADMLTGVVEVDQDGLIQKAGCCVLHQPGPLFGVSSASMLHTPLSRWLNVPASWEGLLLDGRRAKASALKSRAADVKVGPLRRASGPHADGDSVNMTAQAVVKEGGGPPRLVVKLTVEKARKGGAEFAATQLGLLKPSAAALAGAGSMAPQPPGAGEGGGGEGVKSARARGSVKFGDSLPQGSPGGSDAGGSGEPGGSDDEAMAKPPPGGGKADRLMDWVRQSSHVSGGDVEGEESLAVSGYPPPPPGEGDPAGLPPPPESNLPGDDAASEASGGDGGSQQLAAEGGHHSDLKRGKRLRKLARMLSSRAAQKAGSRFYKHTLMLICGLLVAHIACFTASTVLINGQKQFIREVDDAGYAVIAMHRIAINSRVLDALHKGLSAPNIFTPEDMPEFERLLLDAIDDFQHNHDATYLGHGRLRRFSNSKRYSLQDYWESSMWNASELTEADPPVHVTRRMGLWEMGNEVIAAAREVHSNHERMVANGTSLSDSRFWYFIMNNVPWGLYSGYKLTLYGLVERVLAKIDKVGSSMIILLVLEGCVVFLGASAYVCSLIRQLLLQRCNLASVFLVIPNGFLRALASKQVTLDEDADSDDDSDAGDLGTGHADDATAAAAAAAAAAAGGAPQKLNLSLPGGKKGRGSGADGPGGGRDYFKRRPRGLLGRLRGMLNPLSWLGGKANSVDTGKKQLVSSSRDVLLMTAPFLLWTGIIVVLYATSYVQLRHVQVPFQMLNMINFLVFRITRGVLFALETAVAAPNTTLLDVVKAQAAVRLADLEHDYTSFLYGFPALGPGKKRDDLSTDEPALFKNNDLATIFFRETGCLRFDKTACFKPGHKFYDVTHNGLDAMATRFMQETALLVADANADINITSSRLEYIWRVGRADLAEGMATADQIFRDSVDAMFTMLQTVHTLVFVFTLLGGLVLWLGLVRPHLKRTAAESRQIAEMLSCLPPEMDVEGLVLQALAQADDEGGAGGASGSVSGGNAGLPKKPAWPGGEPGWAGSAGGKPSEGGFIPAGRGWQGGGADSSGVDAAGGSGGGWRAAAESDAGSEL